MRVIMPVSSAAPRDDKTLRLTINPRPILGILGGQAGRMTIILLSIISGMASPVSGEDPPSNDDNRVNKDELLYQQRVNEWKSNTERVHSSIWEAIRAGDGSLLKLGESDLKDVSGSANSDYQPTSSAEEILAQLRVDIANLHELGKSRGLHGQDVVVQKFGLFTMGKPWRWVALHEGLEKGISPWKSRIDITRDGKRLSVIYNLAYRNPPKKSFLSLPILAENNLSDEDWGFLSGWHDEIGKDAVMDMKGMEIFKSMASARLATLVFRGIYSLGERTMEFRSIDGTKLFLGIGPGESPKIITCEIIRAEK